MDQEERSLLADLLNLAHEALGEGESLSLSAGGLLSALRSAVRGARDLIDMENDPDTWIAAVGARRALQRALDGEGGSSEGSTSDTSGAGEQDSLDALNDVARLLVGADAADGGGLSGAGEMLARLASGGAMSDPVRASIREASERVLQAAEAGPAGDSELHAVASLMDSAASALEEEILARAAGRGAGAAGANPGACEGPETRGRERVARKVDSQSATPAGTAVPDENDAVAPAEERLPADADTSLMAEFVTECRDYLEKSEAALLTLETDPEQLEAVNTVFRGFHTIKGTSGFLGIRLVSDLAHLAENLFSRIRDKQIRCVGGYADLALRSIDVMKLLIEGVQQALSGAPIRKPQDYDELLRILRGPEAAGVSETADGARTAPSAPAPADPPARPGPGSPVKRSSSDGSDSSVRVRTDRLDRLIDMVGELVIAQSMVSQDEAVLNDHKQELQRKVTHAGKIVRELQDLSMSMRMVPLKPTFQKMARLVRDLAHKSGKQVEFLPSGEDTEIDRNMVDVVGDPLVHMIRNAMDHGIEPPEDRARSRKSPAGRVELAAFHAGGNVVIEMRDDGRGLDRERILRKAVERGLIESDKGMSDTDVFNLIFEPGFSTADTITEVSGRGVGMDVVKRAIQSLRGRVEIASRLGVGTTFSVRLPLTLAVTDGMLVRVGKQRFILPTVSIHMSFRPDPGAFHTVVGKGEMVLLRGNLVPVMRLQRLFGISGAVEDPTEGLLVIVDEGGRHTGLMVDELLGQQQLVAKSLGEALGKIPGVSGGAILGDGRVGLILDPPGLAALARGGLSAGEHSAVMELLAA